ncbi:hypothetical protein NCH01_04690 [Neoasaia chiangmaiensis]|uniref:Glycosyl transferase n=2 Tax=Neoasaia chiangmaiensis TaxID=320497 RepID=A0A1U9KTL1_9PROT|nr:glycosyl transferase [Neoasaia chiangmaiensis]GEN14038.1 hypothetical protein NCH01_04690 [Neoasaia chiangmaiensis]
MLFTEETQGAVSAPIWAHLDEEWYVRRYPEVSEWMRDHGIESVSTFYEEIGQRYGHSPNPYFDEDWYRQAYPDVYRDICANRVRSAFEHYCREGYIDRSPHWLFDEKGYRRRYPDLTDAILSAAGLRNGFDHYLSVGEKHSYRGHLFFDVDMARTYLATMGISGEGSVLGAYLGLSSAQADAGRVSWYFDPVWYLQTYPEVAREIEDGQYVSALHHYLTNGSPRHYSPQEFFSENHYGETHADVLPSLEQGTFRNGYEHFLNFGSHEGRSPRGGTDLAAYSRRPAVRADLKHGLAHDPFAHFVAACLAGASVDIADSMPSESQTRRLFVQEAEALLPAIRRRPLDFRYEGRPDVSVILVAHDKIALTIQAIASLRQNYAGSIDLILVDSGSHDRTHQIDEWVLGVTLIRFDGNVGFLAGCNAALQRVKASAVLYLNNDVRLYPNAVSNSLKRLSSDKAIGAVGAKIVRTNMRLQEAGSIIWRDGATYGYRREDDPNIAEANFVRNVDYCSAAYLIVRTELLQQLDGFDEQYRPAYFEDTDLCLRIVEQGMRVVYDPSVMIEHLEFGSSGTARSQAMIKANHRLFGLVHQDYLRPQQPAHVRNAVLAREQRSDRKRILFIEDRLPLRALGSGYVRSNDIIRTMSALGYLVTVYPVLPREVEAADLYWDFPDDVEVIDDRSLADFPSFIAERAGYYDLIWIGRTHNMTRLLPIMNEEGRHLPTNGAILDTEVIATPRAFERARVLHLSSGPLTFDESLQKELDCAHYCQQIIAVTPSDAALVARVGYHNVAVLGHCLEASPSPRAFQERRDILVLGAIHDEGSPNHDGLMWLANDVLPFLDRLLPDGILVTVAGYVGSDVDMRVFSKYPRIRCIGAQDDLAKLYDRHRVFVAPTRFAGGVPYKVHEAASFGLPVATTSLIAGQVDWKDGQSLLAADSADPEGFARNIARLYGDAELWKNIRENALAAVAKDCDPVVFRARLERILQSSIA